MPVLSHRRSIIIDQVIIKTGHGKEVVCGLNAIDKSYMYKLMSNVQLTESKYFDLQILMHSCTPKKDVILDK